ncbi:PepSY-like domain-containing protein [Chitinophagaceae bacterium LWZ2-11]
MKKIIVLAFAVITIGSAQAQKVDASKVPDVVKTSFAKQFPSVTAVKWEKEKGDFEAGFKSNGKEMSALFTVAGVLKESEVAIKVTELPDAVTNYVKEHYKGKTVKGAAKITTAAGVVKYEAEVNGKDVMFDQTGKFLEEVKD